MKLWLGLFILCTGCGGSAGPSASGASAAAAPSPASSATPAANGGTSDCDRLPVHTRAQYETCRKRCDIEQRNQQTTCTDPNCLQGIANYARQCSAKCEDSMKAAKDAKCFAEP
jgi:hypothetical protein